MNRVYLADSTLREGEQTPGVHFTRDEKIRIARELDQAGAALLDVGMPSVSPEEMDSIAAIAGLGLAAPIGVSARLRREEVDQACACRAAEIFLICPVSPLHVRSKLGMDEEGLRVLAGDVVGYAVQRGLAVNFVAEDASRAEAAFIADMLCHSHACGARRAIICDTVGIMEPFGMKELRANLEPFLGD